MVSVTDQIDFSGVGYSKADPFGMNSGKSMWGWQKRAHMSPEVSFGMRKSMVGNI